MINDNRVHGCQIWQSYEGSGSLDLRTDVIFMEDSPRAGGAYEITEEAVRLLKNYSVDDRVRARLTTWLVDQRLQGNDSPRVTKDVIMRASAKRPLSVDDRADRLLRYLGKQSDSLGANLTVNRTPILAWTESMDVTEVFYLEQYIDRCGWTSGASMGGPDTLFTTITVDGHRRIADQVASPDSLQAFVAMWFDTSMDRPFEDGVKRAIEVAGYRTLRIDRKPDVDKIDDEIIAEIRRSRFLVADFTHGDNGARGGVYFEAGFAHGLGIPVIYTCRSDMVDKLHFDTRQYAHIVWDTPEDLHSGLKNRILARIEEGPGLKTNP